MPRPPSYQKVNPADQPVLYLSVTSDTLPIYTVDEYAETLLSQRISMASGVSQVLVYGAQKYAVRVQLNPDALVARNIGIDEVQRAVQQNPKSARLFFESGLCYLRMKDFPKGQQALAKAHELDPDNRDVAMTYGLCLARAGQPKEAAKALSSVMNRAEADYNVARMMLHVHQPEIAKEYESSFAKVELFTVDDVFGGWTKAQKQHFGEGGIFDQIYKN